MAEKKEKEISVEAKLRALFDLQLVKSEIDKIKTLRGELPLEVQDLEDEIEGLRTRVSNLEREIAEANSNVESRKLEIEENKSAIGKYSEQQNNVKNNREYENLAKEIEYQQLNVQLCEKKIKEFQQVAKDKREDLERTKQLIEGRTMDLNQKKEELEAIVSETKQQEEKLREEAKNHEALIEPRYLNAFDKIRKNARNGLAVVRVLRNACGGCFNQIPPQRRIDIAQRNKVIVCEYCGRIMVDLDLGNEEVKKTGYGTFAECAEEKAPVTKGKKKAASKE
ncbi:MAG: C4-type zinc ribbon domain-containing protein [Paludibacteraceae bacterium]|nr:C4-type zinc ribbon domain-containing protein [Paludibacteraceae bacterium]